MRIAVVATLTGCLSSVSRVDAHAGNNLLQSAARQTRRLLNFGSTFGSATHSATPYERITGHPVFAVTTPWGSPYMNMEKLSDLEEVVQEPSSSSGSGDQQQLAGSNPQSISEEQSEVRSVILYFLDPDDALAVHGEMKQMENMASTDVRITSLSLAKALRQASNMGNGLPTGAPADTLTGNFAVSEGAALRYKVVPPKRQLYYAARCVGRERVGLWGETAQEDAQMVVLGNSAIEGTNLMRRRDKRERKGGRQSSSATTPLQAANAHMEGYSGIPVFYCPQMQRQWPKWKQLITGQRREIPLFFNYEDLQLAWSKLRHNKQNGQPAQVEVFNLWDVLTSMDRDQNRRTQTSRWSTSNLLTPLQRRLGRGTASDLSDITFVPSSRSVQYKEAISKRGNGKARLRPMR